jgi:hypothetical protein
MAKLSNSPPTVVSSIHYTRTVIVVVNLRRDSRAVRDVVNAVLKSPRLWPLFCRIFRQNRGHRRGDFLAVYGVRNRLAYGLYFVVFFDKIEVTGEAIYLCTTCEEIVLRCAYIFVAF